MSNYSLHSPTLLYTIRRHLSIPFLKKFFRIFFEKMLDNRAGLCYNSIRKRKGVLTMTNWYNDPEVFADDYEELQELLKELAEEE